MGKKITIKNIKQFVEGNSMLLGDRLGLVDSHIKEQVEYRASICYESCFKGNQGRCEECGCKVPGKWYVKESCNDGKKFPDLMSKEDWELFKSSLEVKKIIDANED
jgi:hypothetical protein